MSEIFLSVGSNIDPAKHIPACIKALKKKFDVKAVSSIYETRPVGPAGKNNFWNFAAVIETDLDREKLRRELVAIESSLGRTRDSSNKFAPRTIDIDILPQKDYERFAFIMVPLAEIAPQYASLARALKKKGGIRRITHVHPWGVRG